MVGGNWEMALGSGDGYFYLGSGEESHKGRSQKYEPKTGLLLSNSKAVGFEKQMTI